jgi:hypothetical protein
MTTLMVSLSNHEPGGGSPFDTDERCTNAVSICLLQR